MQPAAIDSGERQELSVYRLIGMARRAGRLVGGMDAVCAAVQRKQARLIILAADAAERTARRIEQVARADSTAIRVFGTRAGIGHWTGGALTAVIALTDQGIAVRLQDLLGSE
jgi:ribosomal protein L7Ae-like RNA K-turn-binding protein